MNMMNHLRAVIRTFHKPTGPRATIFSATALALVLGLFAGAGNSYGQGAQLTWTNTAATGVWSDPFAWVTNATSTNNLTDCTNNIVGGVTNVVCTTNVVCLLGGPPIFGSNPSNCPPGGTGAYPGQDTCINFGIDGAWFTNAASYYVKLTAPACGGGQWITIASNMFVTASGTGTITLDLGTSQIIVKNGDGTVGQFTIGNRADTTTTVYLASNSIDQNNGQGAEGLYFPSGAGLVIGNSGVGTLWVTNGTVRVAAVAGPEVRLGNGAGAQGTLIVSGTNTLFDDGRQLSIGRDVASSGNLMVVSNSAVFNVGSSFRMGSGSGGGSQSNTLILDSGALLSLGAGHAVIGKRGGTAGSYDNVMIIRGGAACNVNNHTFYIGWADDDSGSGPATGNVLTVEAPSAFTNFSWLLVRSNNILNLLGGSIGGSFGTSMVASTGNMTNYGTVAGYGTMVCPLNIDSNALLSTSNSLGSLTCLGNVSVLSNSVVQVAVGTNVVNALTNSGCTFPTVVASNLQIRVGTLNITSLGGLGLTNVYTLFTYGSNLTYDAEGFLTVGTVPDASFTYVVDIRSNHVVNLNVTSNSAAVAPTAHFSTSTTNTAQYGTVVFTNTSSGTVTNSAWYWGDDATNRYNALLNPTHIYTNAGTYTVTLTVRGPVGGTSTLQSNDVIVVRPATASFTNNPTSGASPLQVIFYDISDSNGSAFTNRNWNFGDGNTTNIFTTTNGGTITNTYASDGVYTATLTRCGTFIAGGCSSATQIITVASCTPPSNAFTAVPTLGPAPLSVTFTDLTTGTVASNYTDFGDGGWTNNVLPTPTNFVHQYTAAGTYLVTNIEWGCGSVCTSYCTITVLSTWDWWRSNYFGCVTCPQAQGNADPDGDGMSNTNEFLAGTSPTNSLSGLRITSVVRQSGTNIVVTWTTVGSHSYVLQTNAPPASGSYTNNFADFSPVISMPAGGESTTNYTDVGGATVVPSRYYRVRLVP